MHYLYTSHYNLNYFIVLRCHYRKTSVVLSCSKCCPLLKETIKTTTLCTLRYVIWATIDGGHLVFWRFFSLSLTVSTLLFLLLQKEAHGSLTLKILPSYRINPAQCEVTQTSRDGPACSRVLFLNQSVPVCDLLNFFLIPFVLTPNSRFNFFGAGGVVKHSFICFISF